MLILLKMVPNATVKEHVFSEMAIFFREKFPESEIYEYVEDAALIHKIKTENHRRVILPNTISKELCLVLTELQIVQILIGSNNDLTDIVDIIIDPLEQINPKYYYGINFLPQVLVDGQYGKDIAKYLRIPFNKLKTKVELNDAEEKLVDMVSLIYKLEWDSSFFKSNIAYLSSLCLTKNIENYVKSFIDSHDIELVQFRCNCHEILSVQLAEKNKYSFVDIRLTLERTTDDTISFIEERTGLYIRKAIESDIEALVEFGRDIYYTSRYYFDNNFDNAKLDEFYSGWIKKAVLGLFDDFCYVLYEDNTPIGFCSIKLNKGNSASIGVLGLNPDYSNLGLGRYMLNKVIEALYRDGVTYIDVVTQGRNYGAQRLYQRCGFITRSTELWYHKWLSKIN
jgi:dTDP-4-amino-4,6-dideoxy-D-galactose acyltransferase